MVLKTQYTFAIGGTFTPDGFDEDINHVATSWQVSNQPEFGDDGRAGERDFIVYESLVDTTALKTLKLYAEDVFQPFQVYYLRAKYHSNVKSGRKLDPLVLKCSTGSNVVEILGRQNAVTKQIDADSAAIQEIEYAMRVDYFSNLKGLQGGNMFSDVAVVKNIDYTNGTLTLSQNCLFSGAFIFDLQETFQSEWSQAVRFDSTEGLWAILELDPGSINAGQPQSTSVTVSNDATFTVSAIISDNTTLSYQWQKKNTFGTFQNIVGETTDTLIVPSVALTDDQSEYRVVITSIYGQSITSDVATLTVIPLVITIFRNPRDVKITTGLTATFDVIASSSLVTANLTYQWQKQEALGNTWTDIPGATSVAYTTPALDLAVDLGDKYRVIVGNDIAPDITATSVEATLLDYGYDLTLVDPNGVSTNWIFDINGPVTCDSATGQNWTVIPYNTLSVDIKMWGKPTSNQYAGYSEGRVTLNQNQDYRVQTNVGGGAHGTGYGWPSNENGGGYSGIFSNLSPSQSSAIMMAGGSGGAGFGHGYSVGGSGGGSSGSAGTTSSDSQFGSTGGGGGTQSSGGGGGGGGGSAGSALQGGRGGNGSLSGYPNAGGGGGGGGGYYGGGGGGGGNDYGSSTRNASGGGGGSGYINTSLVTNGLTVDKAVGNLKSSGGDWDDTDSNRSDAGYNNNTARVVIQNVLGAFYTDYAGRYLIFANNSYLTPPSAVQKTYGTVFPGDTKCIDNARWQTIRSSAGYTSASNYRIQYTAGGSKKPLFADPPTDYNIARMKDSNVISLTTDLTQWSRYPNYESSYYAGLVHFSWSEDALSSYAGNLWGYGLDYTGLTYGDSNISPNYYSNGYSAYSHSNNGTTKYFTSGTNSPSFSARTLEMWILPPGVPYISATQYYTASVPSQNPTCAPSTYQYGIFTRSGGAQSTFTTSDNRQTVVIWAGQVIYNGPGSIINPFDGTVTVGDYTYEAGTHRGSTYGWHSNGTSCGTASSPNGDFGNAFDVRRWG